MLPLLFQTNTNVTHINRSPSRQSGIYLLLLTRFLLFHIFCWCFIEFGMRQYRGASTISRRDSELTLFIFMFARFQSSFLSTVSPCKFGKNKFLWKIPNRWRYRPYKWGFSSSDSYWLKCFWDILYFESVIQKVWNSDVGKFGVKEFWTKLEKLLWTFNEKDCPTTAGSFQLLYFSNSAFQVGSSNNIFQTRVKFYQSVFFLVFL